MTRSLARNQRTRVHLAGIDGAIEVRYETEAILLEAPNWTLDGADLILNGEGALWRLPVAGGEPERIDIGGVPDLNNDHVLDPDGKHIYVSANDGNLYRASLHGGSAALVTSAPPRPGLRHYLHGVAPDGSRLAFIGLEPGDGGGYLANVFTVAVDGTDYRQLTHGAAPADGCEYSPDGTLLYLNTEAFDGHAQIARMATDGSGLTQLTFDNRVNWFPHLAPDAQHAYYIAFPTGTAGHPANLPVDVMLVVGDNWPGAQSIASVHGGQGTLNVNGWAPTSDRFAFVSYPVDS